MPPPCPAAAWPAITRGLPRELAMFCRDNRALVLDDDGGEPVASAAACRRVGVLQVAGEETSVEGVACRGSVDDLRDVLAGNSDAFSYNCRK
jgi:hypothetical protein